MSSPYMILNYALKIILMNLSREEVLVACRILMQQPNPAFAIVQDDKFVTGDFTEQPGGYWVFTPPAPQEYIDAQEDKGYKKKAKYEHAFGSPS